MNDLPNQGIGRTVQILNALAAGHSAGMRLTDIAAGAKLSKSTTHRLLARLVEVGLVEQDSIGLFHLGFDLFVLGAKAANRYGVLDLANESMSRLVERSADTVYLHLRSAHDAVCIERREGTFPIKALSLSVGGRRPLGIGGGSLALLAALPDADVSRAIEANEDRIATYPSFDAAAIWELVHTTRRQGYAFIDARVVPGMCAIGVAICTRGGEPLAAISIAAIQSRMGPQRRDMIVSWVREEARALEAKLAHLNDVLGDNGMRRLIGAR